MLFETDCLINYANDAYLNAIDMFLEVMFNHKGSQNDPMLIRSSITKPVHRINDLRQLMV